MAQQPVTTPSTSEAVQQAPTAPTVHPPVAPATPKQAAAQSPTAATHIQQLQMFNHQLTELMLHLTDLVMSVRHHNALLNICEYIHDDVTG